MHLLNMKILGECHMVWSNEKICVIHMLYIYMYVYIYICIYIYIYVYICLHAQKCNVNLVSGMRGSLSPKREQHIEETHTIHPQRRSEI